ncbi:hypothetical protein AAF712_004905 [Marasmius tenuissimus]|uniref:Uncharacterized protein n=1 Tax=Marasmius tenuissimus TaxID=585030 RepID=A0ABR3A3Q2_9AGAR
MDDLFSFLENAPPDNDNIEIDDIDVSSLKKRKPELPRPKLNNGHPSTSTSQAEQNSAGPSANKNEQGKVYFSSASARTRLSGLQTPYLPKHLDTRLPSVVQEVVFNNSTVPTPDAKTLWN